jgi:hypothetical protein
LVIGCNILVIDIFVVIAFIGMFIGMFIGFIRIDFHLSTQLSGVEIGPNNIMALDRRKQCANKIPRIER